MADNNSSSAASWQTLRRSMPVCEKWAYFDHAAVAPLSAPARKAVVDWSRQAACEGDTVWSQWDRRLENLRQSAASMIGAGAEEIALVPNTTAGINLVAEGFPWIEGDNVVTLANEFPSNLYPWMNLQSRGVEARCVPVEGGVVDLQRIADSCDDRTRLIAFSWVGFASGWRIDVDRLVEMAHARGILVFLDAIQALGVFPINVQITPVDFLAADGHKWMLAPEGAGIFYMRQEHLERLRPLGVGWSSVVQGHDFDRIQLNLKPTAARYEGGSMNMVGFFALGASLEMLADCGLSPDSSPLAERVLEITDQACDRLQQIGAHIVSHRQGREKSGIVAFDLPGCDPQQQRRRSLQAGVVLNCRDGHLRISPHAYNNQDDVERLIESLR